MNHPALEETVDLRTFEVFPWHESFNTGHDLVDQQHRQLVTLLNQLANTLATDDDYEIELAFNALANYAETHFNDEEAVWREYFGDDEWFNSHHATHVSFLPKVLEIKENTIAGNSSQMIEEVVKFLIRWLAFHILDTDKRMALVVAAIDEGCTLEEAKQQAASTMTGAMHDLTEAILSMYEGLSNTALDMIRERNARLHAENRLHEAYIELEHVAITDQLTGLYNRHYLEEIGNRELARAAREQKPLSIYMIDVDHFKKYNDRYGHVAGDEALQKVAMAIQQACQRPGDFCFRYGGEEFCVLETGSHEQHPVGIGKKILETVETFAIPHADNENGQVVTASIGTVTWVPGVGSGLSEIIEMADSAMYRSKIAGRNRITAINQTLPG